jgi:hypothetical protein
MPNPNWYLGRTGQLYIGEEASYGTAPSLLASMAFRHLSQKLSFDPRQLTKSPERHLDPSQRVLLTRRQKGSFDVKAQWYPSGVLNTVPESDVVLKNGLGGTPTNITLSTTVSSGAGVSGAVVASATGLAARQPIQITVLGGSNPGVYVRWLTAAYAGGTTLTWEPPLPATCAVSDLVKGCTGYPLGTALPKSLDIAHYPQAPSASTPAREMLGCVIDKLSFMFDGNLEPMIQFSGPAQGLSGSSPNFTPQAQPGGFTTVGAENAIPSGLTGYFQYGATLYQIEKMQIDVVNAMDLQNTALGTNKATAFFRKGKRIVTVKIDAKVSDDLTLWTPSNGASSSTAMIQIGTTAAKMFGIFIPALILTDPPDIGDADETNNFSFDGEAMATSGNDELFVAAA